MSYTYDQWRQVSDAVADAMRYAHDKALEHPDRADPLWNLDEYVNRIISVAFPSKKTQVDETETIYLSDEGYRHGATVVIHVMECSECGRTYEHVNGDYEYCPHCGTAIEQQDTPDEEQEPMSEGARKIFDRLMDGLMNDASNGGMNENLCNFNDNRGYGMHNSVRMLERERAE